MKTTKFSGFHIRSFPQSGGAHLPIAAPPISGRPDWVR